MNCTLLVFVLNILSLVIVTSGSTCDQPTSPHGSVIIHPAQREKYQNGQVILFGCKQGFYLDGMPIITCNGNKWTQTQFRCLGFCPELRNILNGKVSHVTPQVGKAAIGFRCDNKSFQLIGRTRLECIDGRWNGKLPYCHKLPSCVRLQSPANGTLHGSDNSHSAEVKFTCFTGFDLFGASTLTCDKGVWSSRVPTCKAYCTKIRDLPNGHVFGTRFSHGQVVSFKCKHGYELGGDRSLRCINGRWNSSVPQCKVMQCVKPSIPRNSRIIYPRTNQVRYTHGTTIYLACHEGHLLTGSPIMVCNCTTWLKREFSCIASCPILGPVRNGVITHVTRKGGGEVEIKCHANYTLFGSSRLSCINGEWSSSIPSCKAPCAKPAAPPNGGLWGRDFRHGQSVRFICRSGYTRVGTSPITCNDGKWNKPFPDCKGVCAEPGKLLNGTVVGSNYSYGSVIKFKCYKGYKLRGSAKIKCKRGVWEGQFPECEECVRVGAVFWGFWKTNLGADNYWKASITRINATHFDFALLNNNKQTRRYRRTDQKLIIDKVPSIGNLLPNSTVIAHQFGPSGRYRTGKVTGTLGDSWVEVQFDDGKKKWVKPEIVRLVSYPDFCSNVE